MPAATYDLLAIGGGTAGLVTAAGGAGLGARVALIERDRLGGECLWSGCVPSKALIAAARVAHTARHGARFGVASGPVAVDWPAVQEWVRDVQRRIEPHDSPERFRGLGVDVRTGHARLVAPDTVEVNGARLRARRIVLATGTRAAVPPIPGLANVPFLTNETVFDVPDLPRRLLVLGGGPIGTELAQSFARLGSAVHLIEALPTFFAREDNEVAAILQARVEADGVQVHLGAAATGVRREGSLLIVTLADGRSLTGDALLVAAGRRPTLDGLGLEDVGVRTDRGGIVTDPHLRTNVPGIFAAGDVVSGGLKFTHVADHMARGVLRNALFPGSAPIDYRAVPWVTYTDPELARVGLTEAEARERLGPGIGVWRRPLDDVDRAIADGQAHGLVKIVTDAAGRVVGGHVVGHHAGELIGELTLAVRLRLTVAQLAATIHPYPTYGEAIRQASEQRVKAGFRGWKRDLVRWLVRRA